MTGTDLSPFANHLWQSTLCAAAAWVLTLALRRNRAAVRYGIWMAASVKFLVPFALLVGAGSQLGWRAPRMVPRPRMPVMVNQIGKPFTPPVRAARIADAPPVTGRLPEWLMLGVWFSGFAASAGYWIHWRRSIRAAWRTATPLPFHLPVPVMASRARLEPGVFGIWKPVLLLPDGIGERLPAEQLQTVLAHELCHVRRKDNLTAAIHMIVESIFWFHPLVWWIRARLVEERERACDEQVLDMAPDAGIYAEAILNVCKFYLEQPLVSVAGVTGSNLKRRIEEIMAHRGSLELDPGRKAMLAIAGLAIVAGPVLMGMMGAAPLGAQAAPSPRLAFGAASVKQEKSNDPRAGRPFPALQFLPGGRLVIRKMPLHIVIATAYDLPFQSDQLTGGPDWVRNDLYDIEATAEEGAIPADATVKVRDAKMRLMLQTLLADRFKLAMRRETRDLPVYAVVVRKGGPKLQKAAIAEKECTASPTGFGFADSCHSFQGGQGRGLHGEAVTITDVAQAVSNWSDRPVVDKTGLDGLYNIQTDGWVPMRPRPPRPPGQEPTAEDLAMADPVRPTLFQIFDRMGLKLESQRMPVEAFVIEHVERPTQN